MPSERTSSAIRLAERQVGRAAVAVPGGLVHLRGPLMCLGGASMTSFCGQVRLARPDVCLIGVACRRESITFSDLTAGSQSCAELTEVFDPSRPAPGFLWVEDLVAAGHVTSLPRVARVRAGDLAIVGARSTDREGPKVMRTCVRWHLSLRQR